MPDTPRTSPINLVEVTDRAERARQIITSFSLAIPRPVNLLGQVDGALADIPILTAEITSLRNWLSASRIERANLAAAGRATIAAYRAGEPDPLSYLYDELLAQNFVAERGDA